MLSGIKFNKKPTDEVKPANPDSKSVQITQALQDELNKKPAGEKRWQKKIT
jgi:hypothetical protein